MRQFEILLVDHFTEQEEWKEAPISNERNYAQRNLKYFTLSPGSTYVKFINTC